MMRGRHYSDPVVQRAWRLLLICFLVIGLLFVLCPLLSVLFLSLNSRQVYAGRWVSTPTFKWYILLPHEIDGMAWGNTLWLSAGVTAVACFVAFLSALNWWKPLRLCTLLVLGFGVASVPAAAYSIALSHCFELVGIESSSGVILAVADVLWVLPFCTAVILLGMSRVTRNQLMAAWELSGGRRIVVVWWVVVPAVAGSITGALSIGLLLTTNEYVRAGYLGGPLELLGRVIYGKLSSGTDPTVYAITGANLAVSVLVVSAIVAMLGRRRRVTVPKTPGG